MNKIEELQKLIATKKADLTKTKDAEKAAELENEIAVLYHEIDMIELDQKYAAIIQENKAKGKKVKRLVIEEGIEKKVLYFRLPDRKELAAAESMAISEDGTLDPYKKAERMIVDLYLGGDYELNTLLDDTELYLAVSDFVLYRLIEQKKTSWATC